jgi:hypothetical protein
MEDSVLLPILQKQTEIATRTEQKVDDTKSKLDDTNKKLFGNGNPGMLQQLHEQTIKVSNDLDKAKEEFTEQAGRVKEELTTQTSQVKTEFTQAIESIKDQITEVSSSRTKDQYWLRGALAVIGVLIAAVGFYFKYIYTHPVPK